MNIHELHNTASTADLTSDNYFVIDGTSGSKKVPSDMVALQQINPATDTQAEIYDKINGHVGGVVVAISSTTGSAVEVEMYQLVYANTEGGVFTARFETTSGGLIKVATCVLNDITASTLGAWTYETVTLTDVAKTRIKDLTQTATEADFKAGNYFALDGAEGTKRLPAEVVTGKSYVNQINQLFGDEVSIGEPTSSVNCSIGVDGTPTYGGFFTSKFFPVRPGDILHIRGWGRGIRDVLIVSFFSSSTPSSLSFRDYRPLSSIGNVWVDETYIIPEDIGIKYVCLSFNSAYTGDDPMEAFVIRNSDNKLNIGHYDNVVNLVDPSKITKGIYLANGSSNINSAIGESDYIQVTAGESLYYFSATTQTTTWDRRYINWYDSQRQKISETLLGENVTSVTVPSGASFVRFPIRLDKENPYDVICRTQTNKWVPFVSSFIDTDEKRTRESLDLANLLNGQNLVNPSEVTLVGQYYNNLNELTTNPNYFQSNEIPCVPGDRFYLYRSFNGKKDVSGVGVRFLDEDKNYVSGKLFAEGDQCILVPADSRIKFFTYPVRKPTDTTEYDVITKYPVSRFTPYNPNYDKLVKYEKSEWDRKKWWAYGTSITGFRADVSGYPQPQPVGNGKGEYPKYLAQMGNLELHNYGFGGGGIGRGFGAFSAGQVYERICTLSDGKADADLITIETGANDVGDGFNRDFFGDVYDTGRNTLCGCLNDCIHYLQEHTSAQIVVFPSPLNVSTLQVMKNYCDWAEMIRRICDINRVYFINPSFGMGVEKMRATGFTYIIDDGRYIHQTPLGGYMLAKHIWSSLKKIPPFLSALPWTK